MGHALQPRPGALPVRVAAAVIVRDGSFLVARRAAGAHLEGLWEFPGGKVEPGEAPGDTVRREVEEEVGLRLEKVALLHREEFDYPDRRVDLLFFLATDFSGDCRGHRGQEIRWVEPEALESLPMPPANAAVVRLLLEQFS